MRLSEPKRTPLIFILLIAAMLMMLAAPAAVLGDDGHGHHHDDNGKVIVDLIGGDNTASVAGSRSYGISGSDMDIGQCIYHAGALTVAIGFRNKFCEGMEMIRSGMVDAGVLHICKQTKIGRNYDTLKDCKKGLAIAYIEQPTKPEQTSDDDEEDRYDALYADFQAFKDQDTQRVAKAEKAAQNANAAAQRAEQRPTVVNQYGMTTEQREDLAKVFKQ